jgi:putative ATPase
LHSKELHSIILWGNPGTGKTTLARMLAEISKAEFISLSAVTSGLKEIRAALKEAEDNQAKGIRTILFIDEVHRFNKTQQDVFLPFVETGTITFIGATTENPSFELNNALLSRCQVYVLNALTEEELLEILERALKDPEKGYGHYYVEFELELRKKVVAIADGDARRALNLLEIILQDAIQQNQDRNQNQNQNQDQDQNRKLNHGSVGNGDSDNGNLICIDEKQLEKSLTRSIRRFDKKGESFYDQISGLHKAVRGSSPDGALYWFARMLDGGCDPLYIARRVVRMASEDIGNADPKALTIALNAWDVQERLGSPEGELAIAQAIVYMAVAAKSNAVYVAFKAAKKDAELSGSLPVPVHLRNAPTGLMKDLGYGKEYRYDHDEPGAFAKGQTYFPEGMKEKRYYKPVARGLEIKIKEKLDALRSNETA